MKPRDQLVHLNDLRTGQALPEASREATRTQLFLFSAATWNPHRIHYDREYAGSEGHPDILVHGPLQGAWLMQYLCDWMGPRGRLVKVAFQNRGRAYPEQPVVFGGRVAAVDAAAGTVDLEVRERNAEGADLLVGTATVRLPSR